MTISLKANAAACTGREVTATGVSLNGSVNASSNTMTCSKYDGTSFLASGRFATISITYIVAEGQ